MAKIDIPTRLCEVDGEIGDFHTWEHYSRPVEASPLMGGAPAGVISRVFAIVEFSDGVRRVEPYKIKFCDELPSIRRLKEESKKLQNETFVTQEIKKLIDAI